MAWSFVLLAALALTPQSDGSPAPGEAPTADPLAPLPDESTSSVEALTRHAVAEQAAGNFCQALADAREAYAKLPTPCLLYRMGQIDRAMHHWDEAASELREYLQQATVLVCPGESSGLQDRSAIEGLIEELDKKSRRKHHLEPPTPGLRVHSTEPGAPAKPSQQVVELTEEASRDYDAATFDEALENAEKAYALQPSADLLYDLGLIHLALQHWEMAAFSLRAYLAASPRAKDRAAIEALVARIAEADGAAPASNATESSDPLPVPFEDPACTGPAVAGRGERRTQK